MIAIVLVVGALYLARSAVVPVLFAVFLAMLLAPAVSALHRLRLPRAIAAAMVVASLVTVLGLALSATWAPARNLLDTAPATMRTLENKLRPVTRLIAKVESVSEQAGRVTDPVSNGKPPVLSAALAAEESTVVNTQQWLIAITTTLMVTFFLLAGGPSLVTRLEHACSERGVPASLLPIVSRISADVCRYFGTMALSSIVLATGTAATMHVLGMPNPLLWGVIAFVLNFIPYAGPATTLTLLTVVALVSFDGLGKALAVAGSFLVLTGLEGQILQPVLVGRRLEVSPLVVLLSLWFGGWLWGIAGVALAVPVLVTIKSFLIERPTLPLTERPPADDVYAYVQHPVRHMTSNANPTDGPRSSRLSAGSSHPPLRRRRGQATGRAGR